MKTSFHKTTVKLINTQNNHPINIQMNKLELDILILACKKVISLPQLEVPMLPSNSSMVSPNFKSILSELENAQDAYEFEVRHIIDVLDDLETRGMVAP